ncbi:hypothetical protein GGR58DRAFT_496767 [Xylaria digitata]|nr:hypothetical protein GGR58DRAFT_496767 [Xylaria digitata]
MRYAYLASGLLWATTACAKSAGERHERREESCGFFGTSDPPVSCTLSTIILPTTTAVDPTTTAADPTTTDADPTTTAADSTPEAPDCPDMSMETTTSDVPTTTTTSSGVPITTSSAVPTTTESSDIPTTTTSAAATSTATPGSGSDSGGSVSGACTPDGLYNCIDGKTYQRCAAGAWSVAMPVAPGTKCKPGQGPELEVSAGSVLPRGRKNRRDTWPINCHLHNWPSASVDSVKEAYSWFYDLWAPLEADAQQCRRIACFGESAVWLCADSLGYKNVNSVTIADKMNELLDGNNGCLDSGNKSMVQGQVFTHDGWCVLVRGGENCAVDAPEQPIFY